MLTITAEAARRLAEAWGEVDLEEVAASAKQAAAESGPAPQARAGPPQWELAAAEVRALAAHVCAHCGEKPEEGGKLMKCAACKAAYFCGRDCQRAAWQSHKRLCVVPGATAGMSGERMEACRRAMVLFKASLAGNVNHMSELVKQGRVSLQDLSSTGAVERLTYKSRTLSNISPACLLPVPCPNTHFPLHPEVRCIISQVPYLDSYVDVVHAPRPFHWHDRAP